MHIHTALLTGLAASAALATPVTPKPEPSVAPGIINRAVAKASTAPLPRPDRVLPPEPSFNPRMMNRAVAKASTAALPRPDRVFPTEPYWMKQFTSWYSEATEYLFGEPTQAIGPLADDLKIRAATLMPAAAEATSTTDPGLLGFLHHKPPLSRPADAEALLTAAPRISPISTVAPSSRIGPGPGKPWTTLPDAAPETTAVVEQVASGERYDISRTTRTDVVSVDTTYYQVFTFTG